MIVVKKERIYSIDVYSFKSTQGTPYQLTFELNDSGKFHDISLVNLTGQKDSKYCRELRTTICQIVFDYLLENRCVLYFNIEYGNPEKLPLLIKFLRWTESEPKVDINLEITKDEEIEIMEVKIKLAKDFIRQLRVN